MLNAGDRHASQNLAVFASPFSNEPNISEDQTSLPASIGLTNMAFIGNSVDTGFSVPSSSGAKVHSDAPFQSPSGLLRHSVDPNYLIREEAVPIISKPGLQASRTEIEPEDETRGHQEGIETWGTGIMQELSH
ncbi:unnamed protein product [Protopolystoma xenopodis]|uniref:Uncharacterized protein n=1 Tax=Protopolystoma xenopodis TaxID=117903 RepID=A0A448X8C5_9PLAT|nr:unnamed protein product [Protopolystoma xenopodis]